MKKLFMILFLGLFGYSYGMANHLIGIVPDGPRVTVTVEFGKKPHCIGWGICDIDVKISGLLGSVVLSPSGGGGGGSWILSLPRENLKRFEPDLLGYFDGQRGVTFDETYVVPDEVKKAVGSTEDLVIKANTTYPMRYENGEFLIIIPL